MRNALRELDWTEIVLDLRRAGLAQNDIARATKGASGEAAIRSYLAGASPVHWRGEVLLTLWMNVTGKPRENAPMRIARPHHAASRNKGGCKNNGLVDLRNVPMLARACGISTQQLLRMLAAGKKTVKAREKHHNANLKLPGFE